IGLIIIFGIYLIFKFEFQYVWGIIFGLAAAFCASVFSIFNARMVKKTSPTVITFYEMLGAFFAVSLIMVVMGDFNAEMWLHHAYGAYILFLGVVCSVIACGWGVAVMK